MPSCGPHAEALKTPEADDGPRILVIKEIAMQPGPMKGILNAPDPQWIWRDQLSAPATEAEADPGASGGPAPRLLCLKRDELQHSASTSVEVAPYWRSSSLPR